MPASNNIDIELLAKLYQESDMNKIKRTDIKKKKWQGIAVKYCEEKNLPLIPHKTLMHKWSKSVTTAQRMRSKRVKSSRATGGGPSSAPPLNPLSELVLSAAEANADIDCQYDCEPSYVELDRPQENDENDQEIGPIQVSEELENLIK